MTDVLLTDARLPGSSTTTRLLLRDGVIVDPALADASAQRISLEGRWVMPGLWDQHVHFTQWAIVRRRLDLAGATSAALAAQIVGARLLAELDVPEPLIGNGYRDALWEDEPTAELLDEVSPHRPVILLSGDLHACWVNTAARYAYGLPHAGVLREADAFQLQMRLDHAAPGDEDVAISEAAAEAAARGVVGIVDLEMARNLHGWTRRMAQGLQAFRVRSGFYPDEFDERLHMGLTGGDVIDETGGMLTVGPLKIITDGSLNTRTAYCHDPYADGGHGVLTYSPAETTALLERAVAEGFTVAVHAIGDRAVTHALDAFAATGARGTIEHAQLVRDEDLARFAPLGVVASMQPEHLWDDRDATEKIWPGRTRRSFPFAGLRDAGCEIVLGSDAPVSPLNPWRAIAAAVHRSADDREPWHPEQSLTRAEALAASTDGARLAAGEVADVVVLDADPLTCGVEELLDMPVAATLVGGRFTHWAI